MNTLNDTDETDVKLLKRSRILKSDSTIRVGFQSIEHVKLSNINPSRSPTIRGPPTAQSTSIHDFNPLTQVSTSRLPLRRPTTPLTSPVPHHPHERDRVQILPLPTPLLQFLHIVCILHIWQPIPGSILVLPCFHPLPQQILLSARGPANAARGLE